jgi:microsomal dipeptidase-like Zn-dependent dipeptidase
MTPLRRFITEIAWTGAVVGVVRFFLLGIRSVEPDRPGLDKYIADMDAVCDYLGRTI